MSPRIPYGIVILSLLAFDSSGCTGNVSGNGAETREEPRQSASAPFAGVAAQSDDGALSVQVLGDGEASVQVHLTEVTDAPPFSAGRSWRLSAPADESEVLLQVRLILNREQEAMYSRQLLLVGFWNGARNEWEPFPEQWQDSGSLVAMGRAGTLPVIGPFNVGGQFVSRCLKSKGAWPLPNRCEPLLFPSGLQLQTYPDAATYQEYLCFSGAMPLQQQQCFDSGNCFINLCTLVRTGPGDSASIDLGDGYFFENPLLSKDFRMWDLVWRSVSYSTTVLLDPSLVGSLQALKDLLAVQGLPLTLTSAYRSPAHQRAECEKNRANNSSKGTCATLSQHTMGRAADVQVEGSSAYCVLMNLAPATAASFCLTEWTGISPHIHIDTRPGWCQGADEGACPQIAPKVNSPHSAKDVICKGCCNEKMECEEGDSDSECGHGSEACQECDAGSACGREPEWQCVEDQAEDVQEEDAGGVCGDHQCTANENCFNCMDDCGMCCPDGVCTGQDNPIKWNGKVYWEDCYVCPEDCFGMGSPNCCGNGKADNFIAYNGDKVEETCANCCIDLPGQCGFCCGNGTCDSQENCLNCPSDCGGDCCGNRVCDSFINTDGKEYKESCTKCCEDCPNLNCGICCGNGICDSAENCGNCWSDCPECF